MTVLIAIWCIIVCKIFVRGNKDSLKEHIETKHKDKVKVTWTLKIKTLLCDLFEPDEEEVEFEGLKQDGFDQLEALFTTEVCEECNDEEYHSLKK